MGRADMEVILTTGGRVGGGVGGLVGEKLVDRGVGGLAGVLVECSRGFKSRLRRKHPCRRQDG